MFIRKLSTSLQRLKKFEANKLKSSTGSANSNLWLSRQLSDPYVEKAKRLNYRCRSAFKLIEINEKHKILNYGQIVIDCGASPGSWTQYAVKQVNATKTERNKLVGQVLAVDKQQIYPIEVQFQMITFLDNHSHNFRVQQYLGEWISLKPKRKVKYWPI